MKKFKLGLLIAAVATLTAAVTTRSVAKIGPFFTSTIAWDTTTGGQPGGDVRIYLAADSLKIGDVVYVSAANTVAKSATLANYNSVAGVIVGGSRQSMNASHVAADVGVLAGTANQRVIVLKRGRAWVTNDANATLAAGALVIPSDATAGRIEVKTTAIDSSYRVLGKVPVGGAVNTVILLDLNVK
jgi:hypothetical protein